MFRRINKTKHKSRQAFTLVELIVVLVILAVIAAIAIPSLIGYIKKAREADRYEQAEAYRVAMQAVVSEYYGRYGTAIVGTTDGTQTPNLRWDKNKKVPNTAEDQMWGEKILNLVGVERGETEPYILVFGVALENDQGVSPYQVVYVGYLEDLSSPSIFYVNGKWMHEYPKDVGEVGKEVIGKDDKGKDIMQNYLVLPNGAHVPVQYFVVSNRSNSLNDIWIQTRTGGEHTLEGHSASGRYGY